MYLQLSKAELMQWSHWPCIKITHFKLCDDNGKYIKFVKMDDMIVESLRSVRFDLTDEEAKVYMPKEEEDLQPNTSTDES